jgi:hypothetical protein
MRVKMILPALTEAISPYYRPIKYSLFPPLGLATLAAYLSPDHEVVIQDEHVEPLDLDDEPELVVIQVAGARSGAVRQESANGSAARAISPTRRAGRCSSRSGTG